MPNVSLNMGLITGVVVNRTGVTLLARLLGSLATPITQATVASIAWKLSDLTAGTVVAAGTFVVAATILNALVQNDPRWTADSANSPGPDGLWGYNFAAVLPASTFPATPLTGQALLMTPDTLQCDVTFAMQDGTQFVVPYRWTPLAAY
jgi:hypothetical protein